MPPPPPPPFNPFSTPKPNQQNQQALGWDIWPNQVNAAENDIWPNQANAAEDDIAAQLDQQLPTIPEEQEPDEVINTPADPDNQNMAAQEELEVSDSGVLAMDDDSDASEGE